jgi:hypothetical protein
VVLTFVLLFALLFGAQALAGATAPAGGVASTGRLLGQTSFAYLGGLRTFAAALLWNRLEPIFDGYYGSFDSSFQTFLPTMRLVQVLDPQFEQSYYVTSFWMQRTGRSAEALRVAEDGLKNNPKSGILHANLAQLLFIQSKGKVSPRLLAIATEGVGPNVTWANSDDQFEGYGVFRAIFDHTDNKAASKAIRAAQAVMKANGAAPGISIDATGLPAPRIK